MVRFALLFLSFTFLLRNPLIDENPVSVSFVGQWDTQLLEAVQKVEPPQENSFSFFSLPDDNPDGNGKDSGIEEYVLNDGPVNKHAIEILSDVSLSRSNAVEDTLSNVSEISADICHDELLRHKLSEVQLKLDEMTKTVAVERE